MEEVESLKSCKNCVLTKKCREREDKLFSGVVSDGEIVVLIKRELSKRRFDGIVATGNAAAFKGHNLNLGCRRGKNAQQTVKIFTIREWSFAVTFVSCKGRLMFER